MLDTCPGEYDLKILNNSLYIYHYPEVISEDTSYYLGIVSEETYYYPELTSEDTFYYLGLVSEDIYNYAKVISENTSYYLGLLSRGYQPLSRGNK